MYIPRDIPNTKQVLDYFRLRCKAARSRPSLLRLRFMSGEMEKQTWPTYIWKVFHIESNR